MRKGHSFILKLKLNKQFFMYLVAQYDLDIAVVRHYVLVVGVRHLKIKIVNYIRTLLFYYTYVNHPIVKIE